MDKLNTNHIKLTRNWLLNHNKGCFKSKVNMSLIDEKNKKKTEFKQIDRRNYKHKLCILSTKGIKLSSIQDTGIENQNSAGKNYQESNMSSIISHTDMNSNRADSLKFPKINSGKSSNNIINYSSYYKIKRVEEQESGSKDNINEETRKYDTMCKMKYNHVFKFYINQFDNSVKLKRLSQFKNLPIKVDLFKTNKKGNARMSPLLQRNRPVYSNERRGSVRIFITKLNEINETKNSEIKNAEINDKIFLSKMRNNPKFDEKIKDYIKNNLYEFNFDLNDLGTETLEPYKYYTIYEVLKAAISPKFFGIENQSLNDIDYEAAEIIEAIPGQKYHSEYDIEVIKQYKSLLSLEKYGNAFKGFWLNIKTEGNSPSCRESASIGFLKDKVILFGGLTNERLNDLWMLTKGVDNCYIWEKMDSKNNIYPEPRYSNLLTIYKNNIFVFQGIGEYDKSINTQINLNNSWKFDLEKSEWSKIHFSGYKSESLKNSAGCLIENMFIIHGGYQGNLSNIYPTMNLFDLDKFSVSQVILKPGSTNISLAFHCAVAAFPLIHMEKNGNTNFWTNFLKWKCFEGCPISSRKIGIYLIGGISSEGKINSDIYVIRPSPPKEEKNKAFIKSEPIYQVRIEKIKTFGFFQGRILSSAIYFKQFIAVFGGRCDINSQNCTKYKLNDLNILNLETQTWEVVIAYGFCPPARWGHCMSRIDGNIIILGGMAGDRFSGAGIYMFDTDLDRCKMYINECKNAKTHLEETFPKNKL